MLIHTAGDVVNWSDSWYTVDGFANQRWQLGICKHWRLWQLIFLQLEGRQVTLNWTNAHVLAKHLLAGTVQALSVFGNEVADNMAKAGAAITQVSNAEEASLNFLEGRVHLIRSRLIAIQRMAMDQYCMTLKSSADLSQPPASAMRNVRRQIHQLVVEHKALKRKAEGSVAFCRPHLASSGRVW